MSYKLISYVAFYVGPIQTGFLRGFQKSYGGTGIVIPLKKTLQEQKKTGIRRIPAKIGNLAANSFFCTHEIEYLGYILSRGGIKPQPKKVQAILALNPPNNVKELRYFLGMVQYYRDMWVKCSEMLAPLSNLVGECGETKTNRKNKVKNTP